MWLCQWRFILGLVAASNLASAAAQSASLGWTASPDLRTLGYTLVYGTTCGTYDKSLDVGNTTHATVTGLSAGQTYYFAVFAYGGEALQSDPSNEVSFESPAFASTVLNRLVFYNHSAWDNHDPAPGEADDAAIAVDKTALLPGSLATFANYTSYSRGINGIMVDISKLGGTPTASDFDFKMGNDSRPSAWPPAPAPSSITVRSGAGVSGSDRVTLIWPDNVIQKKWLQVTVRPTAATLLPSADVFYFGNAIGEYGNSAASATVTSSDALQVLSNLNPLVDSITVPGDFNRDKKINASDALIALNNVSVGQTALQLIDLSGEMLQGLAPTFTSTPPSNEFGKSEAPVTTESIALLGRTKDYLNSIHVWFLCHSVGSVRVWHSASLAPAEWIEIPTEALSNIGDGILEARVPSGKSDTQSYFRFAQGDQLNSSSAK